MSIEELKVEIQQLKDSDKSKEELAMEILHSSDKGLDEVLWIKTTELDLVRPEVPGNNEKFPLLDGPISKKEIFLSVLIGRPYPTYFLDGIMSHNHDTYKNTITEPKELQGDIAFYYSQRIEERKEKSKDALDEKGTVKFGLRDYGPGYGMGELEGQLEVSEKDILAAGLEPEKMGLEHTKLVDHKKITLKDLLETIKDADLLHKPSKAIGKLFGRDGKDNIGGRE